MAEAEHREDYAAEDEHAERVTQDAKEKGGHGERGSEHDSVTPQLRKRDDHDE
jgi:hypothetical protein